jgi:hypothetical protein
MSKKKPPELSLEFFRQQGAIGGAIGGKRVWANMTPEERTERAKKMVAARIARKLKATRPARKKKDPTPTPFD